MKQVGWALSFALLAQTLPLCAQTSSLDALEKDLDQLKQQRQDATTQSLSMILDQLGSAMDNPNAALDLYQKAGGSLPAAAPMQSRYEHETPDEKAQRQAKDDENNSEFAGVVQLHCGLMRFGVLFLDQPNTPNLQQDWTAWLKTAAPIYANISSNPDLKSIELKDSIFNAYFGFRDWGDKDQGHWKVGKLPTFFRKDVIDALRTAHSPDLLAAWDLYTGMRSADQSDGDKWTNEDLPYLKFERATDDFNLAPSADKLATLVDLIKNNPNHPKIDDMISRTKQMMQDFRAAKSAGTDAPAAAPNPDATPPATPDATPPAPAAPTAPATPAPGT